jgi:uncharacterized protein YdhG (YjbR/CyaY superfamily)
MAKNKFQTVDFHDVQDFLDYLPADERRIVDKLRKIVMDCMPHCKEKLAYNVPFYYVHSRICFIWPASVAWGNVKNKGVQFGFCKGYLMTDDLNYLDKGNRKEMYFKSFYSVKEIDTELLKNYIFEAMFVDEQAAKKKTKRPFGM